VTEQSRIRVALAGWSNPPTKRSERKSSQTHLSYYATHFSCVEINSSFYRTHQGATYARWRDETADSFRFSVKMPRSVTHESHLKGCSSEVARFYEDIAELRPKLAVVLIQLPPSLEFDKRSAPSSRPSRAFAERRSCASQDIPVGSQVMRTEFCARREFRASPQIQPDAQARKHRVACSASPTSAGMARPGCTIHSIPTHSSGLSRQW
jgi:uncharacterized protein YecE (DUF72 family)